MIQKLDWDSDFLNQKVAKWHILYNSQPTSEEIKKNLQKFDLIYLVSNQPLNHLKENCVDIKTTYSKIITQSSSPRSSSQIISIPFDKSIHSKQELLGIVLESGKYSRFNLDKKFPNDKFEEMYSRWMCNGIEEINGSKILLIYNVQKKIDGFIQIKVVPNVKISIELIAVAPHARGRGIASLLLEDTKSITLSNNIPVIEVVTQDQNIAATKLYLKNGFTLQKREYIYHLWKE
jgi:dTDP-4-amino-4,6-dideoxy-D-galactose acyltransferase